MIAAFNNLDYMIDKYQTCVFWTTAVQQPNASAGCHQWLSERWSCVQAFCRDVFLVAAVAYSWRFFGVFSVSTVNIFSYVNKSVLTSLDGYFFQQLFRMTEFAWQFAPLSSGAWRFLSTYISQGSVATHLRCGGMFYYNFTTNLLLSLSVKEHWKLVCIWQS